MEITADQLERWMAANEGATPEYALQRLQFPGQWLPEDVPACDEGLELLWQFAQRYPSLYALAEKAGFLDPTHPAFAKNEAWRLFAQHCSTCPKCNEI